MSPYLGATGSRTREACIRALTTEKITKIQEAKAKHEKIVKKRKKDCWLGFFYFSGFSIVHEVLLTIDLLVMFILISLKADDVLDCGWGIVMIPIYPIIFFFVLRVVAYLLVANCSDLYPDEISELDNKYAPTAIANLPRIGYAHYLSDGCYDPIVYSLFLLAGLASLILLTIQVISEGQAMMWIAVFSCFAVVGIFAVMLLLGLDDTCFFDEEDACIRAPALLPLLGFIASCFVVGLRLDEIISPVTDWNVVFVPIYITLGLIVVVPILFFFGNDCLLIVMGDGISVWLAVALFSLVLLTIPGCVFLALLASKLNGNSDYTNVTTFIPIYVQWSLAFVSVFVGWCIRKHVLSFD